MAKWLYEKGMRQVIGLIYQVRNEMGAGWSEEIYHQALVYLLKKHSIPTRSKEQCSLVHRGVKIHTFEPDIIIWDKIVLELKVLLAFKGKKFPAINQAQLFHYLKFHQMSLGALVNFAHPDVGIQRIIYEPPPVKVEENYTYMLPYVNESDKQILRGVQRHIKLLANQYGLGYPEELYRTLVGVELAYQNIACISNIDVTARWEDHILGIQSTPYLLIADRFLLHVRASLDRIPGHDFIKTQSYLKALGLKVGWVVNFGRKALQIYTTAVE